MAETCDGLDNDCANGADDGQDPIPAVNIEGECAGNIQVCTGAGGYQDDPGNYTPVAETCDGLDNDCDGNVDDNLVPELCALQDGVCSGSTKVCGGAGGWLDCTDVEYGPDYEALEATCEGLDNDCDGSTDEGMDPIPADNIEGECAVNVKICMGVLGYQDDPGNYIPFPEICDGLDNDCASGADDGMGPVPADNIEGECAGNIQVCTGAGGYQDDPGNYAPVAETCDGLDNDCANGADDDQDPIPAVNIEGECSGNIQVCTGAGGYQDDPGNYIPVAETCDGLDNDCAGGVDEGMDPIPADNILGECADNVKVCMGVDGYEDSPDNYDPVDEICDGLDNDCDGALPGDEDDEDGDGWLICQGDCDDEVAEANPGLPEALDAGNCKDLIDNDCDDLIDTDPECVDEGGVCGCSIFDETGKPATSQLTVSGLLYLLPIGFTFVLLRRKKSIFFETLTSSSPALGRVVKR